MEQNDHRIIGKKLDLFHIEEDASGMIYWHANGWKIYQRIEHYIRSKMKRMGYSEVKSPQLLPRSLWEKSGHWEKFKHNMFSLSDGDRDFALKPMSCPCHLQIFNTKLRSWRELPFRICEFGNCHRNEPSGSLHGLLRTKAFDQDDAHVLCRPDQVEGEVARFIAALKDIYADFGFDEIDVSLSLRPDVRAGSDASWDKAEKDLEDAALKSGLSPRLEPGGGAFYGPKLEFALKDKLGRSWQCGTIQLDMVLPGRLNASYVGPDGEMHEPVMLHHAILGSIGRFIGILLEASEGSLPVWLSPVQIVVLPIADRHAEAAKLAAEALMEHGLEVQLDMRSESLSRRIVDVHEACVPAFAVIGDKEAESGSLMLSFRGERVLLRAKEVPSHLGLADISAKERAFG